MVKTAIIYTTPTCVYCKMAKEFFKQHGIEFTEKDVSTDRTALEEMLHKSGQLGVPVIEVNEEITVGFNQSRLRELLGIG